MTYIIVDEVNAQKLVEDINTMIARGFEPLGGISTIYANGAIGYAQAMINLTPRKVLSEEFKIIEKGIVPGEGGPEYIFIYQYKKEEHRINLGKGLRNYCDEELESIALG